MAYQLKTISYLADHCICDHVMCTFPNWQTDQTKLVVVCMRTKQMQKWSAKYDGTHKYKHCQIDLLIMIVHMATNVNNSQKSLSSICQCLCLWSYFGRPFDHYLYLSTCNFIIGRPVGHCLFVWTYVLL
jgi:hypothetical protein